MQTNSNEPKNLGRFVLESVIADSVDSLIYRARDPQLDRLVALKTPKRRLGSKEAEKFFQQAAAMGKLNHPAIVPVLDAGQIDGHVYAASEYVDGDTLRKVIRGGLTFDDAAQLAAELTEAVAYAHSRGVIHRDCTPDNILIDKDGRPHWIDFGVADPKTAEKKLSQPAAVVAYRSPEQIAGEAVDVRTDVWSLGVILFEMLTGNRPFTGESEDVKQRILVGLMPQPRRLNRRIPRDLESICLNCLEVQRGRRYKNAQALAKDLRNWQAGELLESARVGRLRRGLQWCRQNRAFSLLVGAAALILIGAGIGLGAMASRLTRTRTETAENARQAQTDLDRAAQLQISTEGERDRLKGVVADLKRQLAAIVIDSGTIDGNRRELQTAQAELKLLDAANERTEKALSAADTRLAAAQKRLQIAKQENARASTAVEGQYAEYAWLMRRVKAALKADDKPRALLLLHRANHAFRSWEWRRLATRCLADLAKVPPDQLRPVQFALDPWTDYHAQVRFVNNSDKLVAYSRDPSSLQHAVMGGLEEEGDDGSGERGGNAGQTSKGFAFYDRSFNSIRRHEYLTAYPSTLQFGKRERREGVYKDFVFVSAFEGYFAGEIDRKLSKLNWPQGNLTYVAARGPATFDGFDSNGNGISVFWNRQNRIEMKGLGNYELSGGYPSQFLRNRDGATYIETGARKQSVTVISSVNYCAVSPRANDQLTAKGSGAHNRFAPLSKLSDGRAFHGQPLSISLDLRRLMVIRDNAVLILNMEDKTGGKLSTVLDDPEAFRVEFPKGVHPTDPVVAIDRAWREICFKTWDKATRKAAFVIQPLLLKREPGDPPRAWLGESGYERFFRTERLMPGLEADAGPGFFGRETPETDGSGGRQQWADYYTPGEIFLGDSNEPARPDVPALNTPEEAVAQAVRYGASRNSPLRPRVVEALSHAQPEIRATAFSILAAAKDPDIMSHAELALKDSSAFVRQVARVILDGASGSAP